jgi:hypothetical protein
MDFAPVHLHSQLTAHVKTSDADFLLLMLQAHWFSEAFQDSGSWLPRWTQRLKVDWVNFNMTPSCSQSYLFRDREEARKLLGLRLASLPRLAAQSNVPVTPT